MAWETKWTPPVAPEWAKPQLDKISAVAVNAKYRDYSTQPLKLGNKTIQVIIVGDLGLDFCEPEEKDEGWNIYHIPTLACFSSAVPFRPDAIYPAEEFEYDKQPLLNWMARVQENYPTSWQVLRLLTPDIYQDNGATAKEIIQEWCLSVKVE